MFWLQRGDFSLSWNLGSTASGWMARYQHQGTLWWKSDGGVDPLSHTMMDQGGVVQNLWEKNRYIYSQPMGSVYKLKCHGAPGKMVRLGSISKCQGQKVDLAIAHSATRQLMCFVAPEFGGRLPQCPVLGHLWDTLQPSAFSLSCPHPSTLFPPLK